MVRLTAFWIALGLTAAAAPVAAQEQSVPRSYSESGGIERADPDKRPIQRAREEAAATAAEAACNGGDLDGCAALGRAYMYGRGKPQNRPVAELVLRDACAADNLQSCLALGELLTSLNEGKPFETGYKEISRTCERGLGDACDALAAIVENTVLGVPPGVEPVAHAASLRRKACDLGSVAACRKLAEAVGQDQPEEEQKRAATMLDQLCQKGDGTSCEVLFFKPELQDPTRNRDLQYRACRGGVAHMCLSLAETVYNESSGPPELRAAALALFDEACALQSFNCRPVEAIRARPGLEHGCARGVMADCGTLGELLADMETPISAPEQGMALLGKACEAGEIRFCSPATSVLLRQLGRKDPASQAAVERWTQIACDGGSMGECAYLADLLIEGDDLPMDRERGIALLRFACEGGYLPSCSLLERAYEEDPSAVLPVADSQYLPVMTRREEAALERERDAERAAEHQAWRAKFCTASEVRFRGKIFKDSLCARLNRAIGGFRVKAGATPWQALLWRPEMLGERKLTARERVECGGALVRPGWVLTAAHCIVDAANNPLLTPGHRIRLGLVNPGAPEGISYPIRRSIPHPMYHERSRAFDIALIEIDTAAGKSEEAVQPIASIRLDPQPLATRTIAQGMPVYVYGWGVTSFGGEASDYLKGVKLGLEDPVVCGQRNRFTGPLLEGGLLCASAPDRSQACDGDSGGPLVTYGDKDRIPTVIGVVSAGAACGTTGTPSRYTRVAKVRDWLDKTMGPRPGTVTRAPRGQ